MASAGKFTHVAALQCVERGLITLDEPLQTHLPELIKDLKVLTKNQDVDFGTNPFLLHPATKEIMHRHLVSYSSGLDHESNPLIQQWRTSVG